MSTLDQWEAEAKAVIMPEQYKDGNPTYISTADKRILALIEEVRSLRKNILVWKEDCLHSDKRVEQLEDLVRKKDEALKFAESVIDLKHPVVKAFNPIKSALALTERLK